MIQGKRGEERRPGSREGAEEAASGRRRPVAAGLASTRRALDEFGAHGRLGLFAFLQETPHDCHRRSRLSPSRCPRLDRLGGRARERPLGVRIIESNEDTLLYATGHVPGAVHVDWTSDLNDQLRRDYIEREGFEALMAKIGVTPDTTVVFYGDKNNWWACYAFWVFQLFGHTKAHVMDGGRLKWQKEGREWSTDAPTYPMTSYKAPERDDARHRILRDEVHPVPEGRRPVRRRAQPRGIRRHAHAHARVPRTKARSAAATSPAPRACRGPRRSTPKTARSSPPSELTALYVQQNGLDPREGRRRLLPHRRAQQPHLVRADLPARLREGAQLRRQLDRVGQPGRRADREVARGGDGPRSATHGRLS